MKLLAIILIGLILLTFSWGWIMNVHYGNMTTDRYTHSYLQNVEILAKNSAEMARDFFRYLTKLEIARPKLEILKN